MEREMERIAILLQRRYNCIREIGRLTEETEEAFARGDHVSATMLLNMRGEEMEKADSCNGEIWKMADEEAEHRTIIRTIMTSDPYYQPDSEDLWEIKIFEIRRKTAEALKKIRVTDNRMNRRVAGDRSYYAGGAKR